MDTVASAPVETPAAPPCPGCAAPLDAPEACSRCHLPLTGALAARLGEIDTDLSRLDRARSRLWAERTSVLDALYRSRSPLPTQPGARADTELLPNWPAPLDSARAEVGSRSVQNTLLTLGSLLLGAAALVFAAVSYGRLGPGGRAAMIALLAVVVAAALPQLLGRRLPAAAESFAAVWLALGISELALLRAAGVFSELSTLSFVSWGVGVLALLTAALASTLPLRVLRAAAPLLMIVPAFGSSVLADLPAGLGALLLALLAAPFAILALTRSFPFETRIASLVSLGVIALGASSSALGTILNNTPAHPGGLALMNDALTSSWVAAFSALMVLLAQVALSARATTPARPELSGLLTTLAAAGTLVLVCLAGFSLLSTEPDLLLPPLLALSALLMLALTADSSLSRTRPIALVGYAGVILALLSQLPQILSASLGHLLWDRPWEVESLSVPLASLALTELSDHLATALTIALAAVLATLLLARTLPASAAPLRSGAILALVALVPLALNTLGASLALAQLLLALGTLALLGLAAALTRLRLGGLVGLTGLTLARLVGVLELGALLLGAQLLGISLQHEGSSLAALPLLALLLAAHAVLTASTPRPGRSSSLLPELTVALGLIAAWVVALAAAGAWGEALAPEQIGASLIPLLLALAALPRLLAAASPLPAPTAAPASAGEPGATATSTRMALSEALARAADVVAVALTPLMFVLSFGDAGWFSWSLAAFGLAAALRALASPSLVLAHLSAVALAASSWVRLVDAEIEIVEFYTVPLALVVLGLGLMRSRANPQLSSLNTFGSGLSLLLVPSLLSALDDTSLTRPILLMLAGALVLGAGVLTRLRAPILFGSGVLLVETLDLLGPWVLELPRALTLGLLGAALLAGGVRYEQMRESAARLRAGLDALE